MPVAVITGGAGNDTVVGGAGNDTFIATNADGTDSYNGGTGVDTLDMSRVTTGTNINLGTGTAVTAGVTDTLVRATVVGGVIFNSIENAIGSATAANTLVGDGSGNLLVGGAANDIIDGRAGADTMIGGAGSDTYTVDNAGDVVIENAADAGNDAVQANASYTLAAGTAVEILRVNTGVNAGLALAGNEFSHTITGGKGNDTLTGGTGNDTLDGGGGVAAIGFNGGGANVMAGGAGDDTYFVYSQNDVVQEAVGGGNDTVSAWSNYILAAGVEVETLRVNTHQTINLSLTGNEFSHSIIGGAGSDTLTGGIGNDTINGGVGTDSMAGGAGNDTYVVDNSADVVTEAAGGGSDTIWAGVSYALNAGSEIEFLKAATATGATLNSTVSVALTGNALANTIIGGSGADTLDGGVGADTLTGGTNADTFVYTALTNSLASGFDTITDFNQGADVLKIGHTVALNTTFFNLTVAGTGSLATDLAGILNGNNFKANGADKVTITGGADAGIYAVINDGVAGYNSATDAVVNIHLAGGNLTANSFIV